jgi:hypothetical protein
MPYAHGPSVRRLSKIATLLLAKNYILMLQKTVDEMKRLLSAATKSTDDNEEKRPSSQMSSPVGHRHARETSQTRPPVGHVRGGFHQQRLQQQRRRRRHRQTHQVGNSSSDVSDAGHATSRKQASADSNRQHPGVAATSETMKTLLTSALTATAQIQMTPSFMPPSSLSAGLYDEHKYLGQCLPLQQLVFRPPVEQLVPVSAHGSNLLASTLPPYWFGYHQRPAGSFIHSAY